MTDAPSAAPTPSPAPAAVRPPWRFGALVTFTIRSCVGTRRWLGCLLPSLGAVLFGLLARGLDQTPIEALVRVASQGIFGLTLPIAALVIGDAVFGAEARSGVLHFTWMSPTPLTTILLARWLGGWMVALVTIVPGAALAAVVAGVPGAAVPAGIGAAAGAGAYIAIFIAIGCIARRAAVWSLAFVFLVERLLGAALNGIAQLSPSWEARGIFVGLAHDVPAGLIRKGIPIGGAGIVRLEIVTMVALVIARWRLQHLALAGASD